MSRIPLLITATAVSVGLLLAGATERSLATPSWQWYKADFHVHSVVSADAFPDLGVISSSAKANGYNAIFLTDHNLGSNFPISGMTANHMFFEDSYRRWTTATTGALSASTNQLVTSPVASGTSSLHLASTSSTAGETFVWTKRGPNFRTGTSDAILRFNVYPTQLDAGSGLYVSAAIGGDPTVRNPANNPVGYTTTAGAISPGKSTVFVFYFGAPPPASFYGSAHVLAYNLDSGYCDRPFQLSAWISCTIDVRSKLADVAPADQPLAYNALSDLKMSAVGQNGTANAYFDTYSIDATSSSADEFVERNAIIGTYDTPSFHIFPSVEMGVNKHANRFNFGITDPAQFTSYADGINGILPTQQTGYPAQLNHPGVAGGVTDAEAISTDAEGADLLEVRQQNMINDWDAILRKGVPVVGTWGGDNHIGRWTLGSQVTFVSAPALTFDDLMQSIFEGRAYMGQSSFVGGFSLNLDPASPDPYPARYPVYVSPARMTIPAHVAIGGGLRSGDVVKWLANNGSASTTSVLASDPTSSATYDASTDVPLGGASAYVRAEVRSSSGVVRGLSEPILLSDVAGLPADISYHVQRITTPSGHDYTRIASEGLSSTAWDATANELSLDLTNPAGSLVELRGTSASPPTGVEVDGAAVSEAASLADFDSATGSTWFYDSATNGLYLKVLQASASSAIRVGFGPAQPPPPQTIALNPTADAFVNSAAPTTNFGLTPALYVDGSPIRKSYLRFDLSSVANAVSSATLRVWANSAQSVGYDVFGVDDTSWVESTIDWDNQPTSWAGSPTGSSGRVTAGTWTSVDVTPLVQAAAGGELTFGLSTTSTTNLSLGSRESLHKPQLVIATG